MSSDRELINSTLVKLYHECRGLLAFEDELRLVVGNTNLAVLKFRMEEAREVIESYELE